MEELSEALKAIERELNFAKKAYRASVFLYWAWAMPGVYLLAQILSKYAGIGEGSAIQLLSLTAVVGFIVEERKAFRRVIQLEEALGHIEETPRGYVLAQVIVWPLSALIASVYTENEGLWLLVFIGLGLLLLTGVEFIFTGKRDWKTALAGVILLSSTALCTGFGYAVMVIAFAFSLTAYLHLKGAMRE